MSNHEKKVKLNVRVNNKRSQKKPFEERVIEKEEFIEGFEEKVEHYVDEYVEKVERTKKITMVAGVTFFMLLISLVYFYNLKYNVANTVASNNNEPSLESNFQDVKENIIGMIDNYNEIKERKYIIIQNEPFEVIESHVSRQQQRKPVNKTKLKSLLSGRVIEHTFQTSDIAEEADMSKKNIIYIYKKGNEYWFHTEGKAADRFMLSELTIGNAYNYIQERDVIEALSFTDDEGEEKIIGLKLPVKIELEVTEAPPSIKGNTATGGDKLVTLKTGLKVTVPLFINVGDVISVNTETGEYTERISKAS
jgi:elongation factor P